MALSGDQYIKITDEHGNPISLVNRGTTGGIAAGAGLGIGSVHSRSGSSSSEGLKEKLHDQKDETTTTTTPHQEMKEMMEKIKEKLPAGAHH